MLSDLETRVLSTTAITHRIRGVTIAQVRYALDRMHEAGELDKDLVRTGDGKQVTSLWSLP